MSKKMINSISMKFNKLDDDEIKLLNNWIATLKNENKSISGELQKILLDKLKNDKNGETIDDYLKIFQTSIFYAFRKSIFASLSGYHSNMKFWFEKVFMELEALEQKQNLMLHGLIHPNQVRNPQSEMLLNPSFIKQFKDEKLAQILQAKTRSDEKNKEISNQFERFSEVAFDDDSLLLERMKKVKNEAK